MTAPRPDASIVLHHRAGGKTIARILAFDTASLTVDLLGVTVRLEAQRVRGAGRVHVSREHGYATDPRAWPARGRGR